MNKAVRDRKIMDLLNTLGTYDLKELSESQLTAFTHMILEAEKLCKWLDTSYKCKNLKLKIERELTFRFDQMKWWGVAS